MKAARGIVPILLFLLVFHPAHAAASDSELPWNAVSDSGLTVRYRGPSDVFARRVLERAGTFLADTSLFLGLEWEGEYSIVLAGSRDEFIRLQPTMRPAPEWAGALTYPGLRMVLIMTPGAMDTGGTAYWSLLQHEMAHLVLGEAESRFQTRLPRWFQEGVATYVSGEMNLARLLQLGWAQATGGTPDFRELEFSFPSHTSRAEAAYARSYLFIKYLTQRFGEDAVARLVAESLRTGGIGPGVAVAFNVSLGELLAGFDQFARVKATWIPVITSTATIWGGITILFFITWFRKKVQGLRTVQQWEREEEEEEVLAASTRDQKRHEKKHTLH